VPSYSAAKGGVAQITKALANEWAGRGVNVNAIAPGYMRTENTRPLFQNEERRQAILERIPAGRWGEPEDLCGAAVFLASPASDYVHGHVLVVDGGWMDAEGKCGARTPACRVGILADARCTRGEDASRRVSTLHARVRAPGKKPQRSLKRSPCRRGRGPRGRRRRS